MKTILFSICILFTFACNNEDTLKRSEQNNNTNELISKTKSLVKENETALIDSITYSKYHLDTLRIKRNEIYARHGYIFNSKDLNRYFKKYDWYSPKYHNVDSLLNDTEKKNLNIIRKIESSKKKDNKERSQYLTSLPDLSDSNRNAFKDVKDENYKYISEFFSKEGNTCCEINGKRAENDCIFIFVKLKQCSSPSVSYDEYYILIYDIEKDLLKLSKVLYTSMDEVKYSFKGDKMYLDAKKYEPGNEVDEQTDAYIPKYTGNYKKVFLFDSYNKDFFEITQY